MTTKAPDPRKIPVDGRTVGIYEYGEPAGAPVMVLHGTPACGAGFAWADEPARERGLRLIAPDRPGVGLSSPLDHWTVADYPAQLGALADAMEIDRFAVWGYSGGGPYAAASAALMPKRLTTVVVAAGMGQVGVWAKPDDFEKTDRQMLGLATNHPAVARAILGVTARLARMSPKSAMKSFEKQLSDGDRELVPTLGTPAEGMALFTQAFLRGARGVVADYAALAQPWGVEVGRIEVPVSIFHGDADTMVPLRHSEELAARVPNARLTVWPGAGHLGTVAHVGEVLDAVGA
jgi:pimeloyl-ACP methyl ester carboxylesterase